MNQLEYQALEDEYLSHEARSLYVMCLRRHMDFSTGLVGTHKRKISYQQFKEQLSVSRPRRSTVKPFTPSTQQLRGFIEELVRVGLVVRMPKPSKYDPMVFRLPLATSDTKQSDFFHSNEEQHLSNKGQQQKQSPLEGQVGKHEQQQHPAQKTKGFQSHQKHVQRQEEQQEEQQPEQHLSNIHEQHTSVTSVNNSLSITGMSEFDQRFAKPVQPVSQTTFPPLEKRRFSMSYDWQLDRTFNDQAYTLGVNLDNLTEDDGERLEQLLTEFRTYWADTREGTQYTQRFWQQRFINDCVKRELKKQQGHRHEDRHSPDSARYSKPRVAQPYTAADFDPDASW